MTEHQPKIFKSPLMWNGQNNTLANNFRKLPPLPIGRTGQTSGMCTRMNDQAESEADEK